MIKLHLDICALTDLGLKRQLNEDSCFAEVVPRGDPNGLIAVLAVADGMGGHDAGDVAAHQACDFLFHLFARGGYHDFLKDRGIVTTDLAAILTEAFLEVHQRIRERAASFRLTDMMGATCTTALIRSDPQTGRLALICGSVGDSRCYIVRGEELILVTQDDSAVWEMLRRKEIRYDDIRTHPKRSTLTQALGMDAALVPSVVSLYVSHRDIVLVCTDGLHGVLSDREIGGVLRKSRSAATGVRELVKSALDAGGKDNISVAVSRWGNKTPGEELNIGRRLLEKRARLGVGVVLLLGALLVFFYFRPSGGNRVSADGGRTKNAVIDTPRDLTHGVLLHPAPPISKEKSANPPESKRSASPSRLEMRLGSNPFVFQGFIGGRPLLRLTEGVEQNETIWVDGVLIRRNRNDMFFVLKGGGYREGSLVRCQLFPGGKRYDVVLH